MDRTQQLKDLRYQYNNLGGMADRKTLEYIIDKLFTLALQYEEAISIKTAIQELDVDPTNIN